MQLGLGQLLYGFAISMIKVGVFFFSLLFFNFAWAQSQGALYERPRTTRSLGMGGMFIPIVNDTDALIYNPAALAKVQGINLHLLQVSASANGKEAYDIYKNLGDLSDPNTYNKLFGKRLWAELSGEAAFAVPYFGFGYYTDYNVSLELHNPGFPTFETYFRNDTATVIGGAFSIGPNSYGGVALKRIDRWGGETIDLGLTTIANANDLKSIGDNFNNKGQGYGVDLAAMTELEGPMKSTLALVWQDVGSTAFTKTSGADAPPRINQNLSFGASTGFDLPGLDWMIGLEGRHLLEPDIQIGKKVHIGTELSLPLIDIRAGINQGYVTYGAGVNLFLFRLDAAVYTEELGVYPGQTAEERYMVSLSIDLSFDANFNFTDNNGKKRKLKQRR